VVIGAFRNLYFLTAIGSDTAVSELLVAGAASHSTDGHATGLTFVNSHGYFLLLYESAVYQYKAINTVGAVTLTAMRET